jgi:hypothetical protein
VLDKLPVWSITLLDSSGTSGITKGTLVPGLPASTYLSAIDGLAASIDAITGCVVVRTAVTFQRYDPTAAVKRSNAIIPTQCRFNFIVDGIQPLFSFATLPMLNDVTVVAGCQSGLNIDLSLPVVQAFIDTVVDGLTCDPFGIDIVDTCSAYLMTVD